jgi:hypothetical protein
MESDDPVTVPAGEPEWSNKPTETADPEPCPVCGVAYDSLSVHDAGLMVNLLDNQRYRRVCFEPWTDADGTPLIRFYHHTHDQATLDA